MFVSTMRHNSIKMTETDTVRETNTIVPVTGAIYYNAQE